VDPTQLAASKAIKSSVDVNPDSKELTINANGSIHARKIRVAQTAPVTVV